jgi:hypothetical protein
MSERLHGTDRQPPRQGQQARERSASKVRRQRIFWGVVLLALVAGGAVLAATSEGSVVRSAGAILLLGGAAVLVVSLAFLEVGFSEDSQRTSRFGRPGDDDEDDLPPERVRRSERFFR